MSEIDDIFARLGGGPLTRSDERNRRDVPRRGKAGGNRVVEVVHLAAGRPGVRAAATRRTEPGVRAQTWDDGFPMRSAPPSSPLKQPEVAKAPEPVGHVITRSEPVAQVVANTPAAPEPVEIQPDPVDQPIARSAGSLIRQKARPAADPFDPDDNRANCLRCGYAVETGRDRRGFMTCEGCAAGG